MNATSQAKLQQDIHVMAYQQIHNYIQHLIPLLEQRQFVAKRIMNNKNTDGVNEELTAMIEWCNNEILQILTINKAI